MKEKLSLISRRLCSKMKAVFQSHHCRYHQKKILMGLKIKWIHKFILAAG